MTSARSAGNGTPIDAASSKDPRIAGLYAVTPDLADSGLLEALVAAALEGGAALVQYRNKAADDATRAEQASRLAVLCATRGVPLIINDHLELALSIEAAGLHVGADDVVDLGALRARLGPSRILGVSCYRSLERARAATESGATYVAFGSMFASTTKPAAPPATLALFDDAHTLDAALVGIGGITRDNIGTLVDAGADAAAVIGDLFASYDAAIVLARARSLGAAFARRGTHPYHARTPKR